jgi:hypothetical protein
MAAKQALPLSAAGAVHIWTSAYVGLTGAHVPLGGVSNTDCLLVTRHCLEHHPLQHVGLADVGCCDTIKDVRLDKVAFYC